MADQDELHLQTLTNLERQVRQQYGRGAEAMLANMPLDYEARVRALRRMVGEPEPTPVERQAQRGG